VHHSLESSVADQSLDDLHGEPRPVVEGGDAVPARQHRRVGMDDDRGAIGVGVGPQPRGRYLKQCVRVTFLAAGVQPGGRVRPGLVADPPDRGGDDRALVGGEPAAEAQGIVGVPPEAEASLAVGLGGFPCRDALFEQRPGTDLSRCESGCFARELGVGLGRGEAHQPPDLLPAQVAFEEGPVDGGELAQRMGDANPFERRPRGDPAAHLKPVRHRGGAVVPPFLADVVLGDGVQELVVRGPHQAVELVDRGHPTRTCVLL
jgi:hypothetical protein